MRQLEHLKLGNRFVAIVAGVLFVCLAVLDATTSTQLNLFPLYLAPVLLVTWYAGPAWGTFLALASMATSVATGIWVGHHYSSDFYFYIDLAGRLLSFLVFLWVVTIAARLKAAYERERLRARTDFLTGIANRGAFEELLVKEMERLARYRRPFTVISLDCDNFKAVNDRLGHAAGDALLGSVARTLASSVRKTDVVARVGGDEFVVLLSETGSDQGADLLRHLQEALNSAICARWPVTFSIGAAFFERVPRSAGDAMAFADSLMYQAKHAGKNRTVQASYLPARASSG